MKSSDSGIADRGLRRLFLEAVALGSGRSAPRGLSKASSTGRRPSTAWSRWPLRIKSRGRRRIPLSLLAAVAGAVPGTGHSGKIYRIGKDGN